MIDAGHPETEAPQICVIAYLSLGSNLGDRRANLAAASAQLRMRNEIQVQALSSLYETAPQGGVDQPWFLNQVARIETVLPPTGLLLAVQQVERDLGRVRESSVRWGPRLIDLDILLYGQVCLETPSLIIPHVQLEKRRFVLEPLLEVQPDLVHPRTGRSLAEYLKQVHNQELLRL